MRQSGYNDQLKIKSDIGPVEYLDPMAHTGPRRNRHEPLTGMFKKHVLAEAGSPSSKAVALLARGAYSQYVSTAQG